jgi:hypothetical protein
VQQVPWTMTHRLARSILRKAPIPRSDAEVGLDPEQTVRQKIEGRSGEALIPSTASRETQRTVDKAIYAMRNRIERFFNRLLTTGRDPIPRTHRELRSLRNPGNHSNLDQVCQRD